MLGWPKAYRAGESVKGLEYLAMIVAAASDLVRWRDLVTGAAAFVILAQGAQVAGERGYLEPYPTPEMVAAAAADPVLLEVGRMPIRVSDARAQASFAQIAGAAELAPEDLFAAGLVQEAADQQALAAAAEGMGLDEALEIKAELALARRRILSSAYLDYVVSGTVTDEAVREAYDRMTASAAARTVLTLRRLKAPTKEDAADLAEKVRRGASVSLLARTVSTDETTAAADGLLPPTRLSDLPSPIRDVVAELPLGEVSAPLAGEDGFYVVVVEARSTVALPSFEAMREKIERELTDATVARTVTAARVDSPIRQGGFGPPGAMTTAAAAALSAAW